MTKESIIKFFNKQGVRNYLAFGVVGFTLTYLICITFIPIPKGSTDLVTLSFGWVTGATTMILGYYFGSVKKDEKPINEEVVE